MSDFLESKIKVINKKKRFGYIEKKPSEEGKDYFFLEKDLVDMDFDSLTENMCVSFQSVERKNTRYAKNIRRYNTINTEEYNQISDNYLLPGGKINNSELIIGIVSSVGTESKVVIDSLKSRLEIFEYDTEIIKISSILPPFSDSKK
ncbi:TPA: cold shock domain-containing protein, partial [Pasteurella multocida]|nr:cold shock domain-containing protein [Pasteurella multocida]